MGHMGAELCYQCRAQQCSRNRSSLGNLVRERHRCMFVCVAAKLASPCSQAGRQAASCIVRTNTVAFHTGPAPVHWLTQLRLSFHPFSPCTPPRLTTTWSVATTSPMATWAAQAGPAKVKPARAAYRPHHRAPARRLPVPLVIAKYAKT